jgi:hypothetical protein
MYSDYNSYKNFGRALINWDASILMESKMLDERLFYLGLGIIENKENYFKKILLGKREDKGLSTIGRAIVRGDIKLLEAEKDNARVYTFGKALLENSLQEITSLKYDSNLYNLAKAIILGDEYYLDLLNNIEVERFFSQVNISEFSGIKNVVWDHSFILQCLVCQDEILPDKNGYFSYYFASNENKSINHTFIYFKEVKRHMFYKFCSKECCAKWVR